MLRPLPRTLFAWLVLASALLVYLSFQSIGLDDFDSFAFAFGLERWETALREVHPPGFPVYLVLAKGLHLLVNGTRLALTLCSALSGALGLALLPSLGRALGAERAGGLAALLLIFLPGYWLNSELALSDMPGLALVLLAMVVLLRGGRANFALGCFLAGLSLGVRPHSALGVALAGLLALARLRPLRREAWPTLAWGLLAGALGVSLWLAWASSSLGGLEGYLQRLDTHRLHVQTSDSLFGRPIDAEALRWRAEQFAASWGNLLAATLTPAPLLLVLGLLGLGLLGLPLRHRFTQFVGLWLLAELAKVFLFVSLERPRLLLPALVPLLLLLAFGYGRGMARWPVLRLGLVALLLFSLWRSLPPLITLNQVAPSPQRAAAYVLAHYPQAESSVVLAQSSFMAARYHLGAYHHFYPPYYDEAAWAQDIQTRQAQTLIVFDGDEIPPPMLETLLKAGDFVPIEDRVFERDRRVFLHHSTVRLQVFIPQDQLKAEHLALPADQQLEAANPEDGRFFGAGWYRAEGIGSTWGRWADQSALLRVALPAQGARLSFSAAPYMGEQSVTLFVNGQEVGTLALNTIWGSYQIDIPASAIAGQDISTLELRHRLAENPPKHSRRLASAYSIFHFAPLASP